MLWLPVTSIFSVIVALYCSGSRVSIVALAVVVVPELAFEVFVALVFVVFVLTLVLALVAGCCWQALPTRISCRSNAPAKNLADGFKTKLRMRLCLPDRAALRGQPAAGFVKLLKGER
jgi:uncharacterized protein (DUF58 family)